MALRLARVILWSPPSASPGLPRNDGSPPAVASGATSAVAWLGGEHLHGNTSCSGGSGSGSSYGGDSSRRSSCSNATCSGWTGYGDEGSFMFVRQMHVGRSLCNSGGGSAASAHHLARSGAAEGVQATAPRALTWRKGTREGRRRSCSIQRPNASSPQPMPSGGRVTKKVAGAKHVAAGAGAGAGKMSSSMAFVKHSVEVGLHWRWGEGGSCHSHHLPAVGRTGPPPFSSSTVNGGSGKRNSRRKSSLCRCETPAADGGGGNSAGTATDGSSTTTSTSDNGSAASSDSSVAPASKVLTNNSAAEKAVLSALAQIIDPDFGMDIVSCGFVKDLVIDEATGHVSFRLELTTPACPIKDEFERQARDNVSSLDWVKDVSLTMSAQPPRPLIADDMPAGLRKVSNIIAVSSCKGGVGKSTVAVNLAYSLAMMGARVGIFDADIYGPSLPTMVNPEVRVMQMDPETKAIFPIEFEGVKIVSMGFAGQGSAIMRGPMVSGVINQLMTSTAWGELDYLVIDMPPGTGDIHLTLCQLVPLTAAVVVTTPQRLAFIDVVKGVRMFAKLKVPCVAVVENMCYFEADSKRYFPFGEGSGQQVADMFGIPFLAQLPIRPELSTSGDSGLPEVIADPAGEIACAFQEVGVAVVQECAKFRQQVATAVRYDPQLRAIVVKPPGEDEEFYLHPATVRRNDRSARSVDEWTGEQMLRYSDVMENIEPESIRPMGNYAVAISWPDGLTQVAPFDQLQELERLIDPYAQQEALASSGLSSNSSEWSGKPEEGDGEWEEVVEKGEETWRAAGDRAAAMTGEGEEKMTGAQSILHSANGLQRERHAAQQD